MRELMQIGEIAREANVNTQTIRFYERLGLLQKPPRTASGYRRYAASTVDIVRFIKQSQEFGYTLSEIKQLLALRDHKQGGNAIQMRALAMTKISNINERIASLEKMRDELEIIVANCHCGDEMMPDCPVLEKLDHKATNFEKSN
jgi:DNA-binding transcriptional MerR regulator